MADEDMVARMEALLAEKEKSPSVVGKVMRNGGGAVTGAFAGSVVAPLVVGGVAAILAPFTGGLSVAAAAALTAGAVIGGGVMGHKMSKDVD
jgi:hypothetical protein